MSCSCHMESGSAAQNRVLRILLAINAVMFVVEVTGGVLASSTGLIADSLDMFADAAVYGIALYAVGRSLRLKAQAAYASGVIQCLLGVGALVEVARHWLGHAEPHSLGMIGVGLLALAANLVCLALLAKHRDGEVHMRASWIFSANDVLANLGVIVAGSLVIAFDSPMPDWLIGILISALVFRGGLRIVSEARSAMPVTV